MATIGISLENSQQAVIQFDPEELSEVYQEDDQELTFGRNWQIVKEIFGIPDDPLAENFFIYKILQNEVTYFLVPIESLPQYIQALNQHGIPVRRIQ